MRVPLLSVCLLPGVLAYGDLGHRTIGYLAEKHLSANAKTYFDKLLANPNNYDYSDAATWADSQKRRWPWSSQYHYINPIADNPPSTCHLNLTTDCPPGGCIISAITNYTNLLLTPSLPPISYKNATMFLLHLLGDLHQPLHISGYKRGGNDLRPLCWKRSPPPGKPCAEGELNLHEIWDTRIPHALRGLALSLETPEEKAAAEKWAAELYKRQKREGKTAKGECGDVKGIGCIVRWAEEANKAVCEAVMKKGEGWIRGHDLSGEYAVENGKVVDVLVGKAGLRLAAWLNGVAEEVGRHRVDL